MKMLACMLELCLHLLSSWVCSYSSVYLYKLRCNSMGEHWMFMPDVHVGCHLEVRRGSFIWGTPNTSCLICPYHTKLWPTAIDAPFLASFLLTAPPLSQRASQVYLSPLSWSLSMSIHGGQGQECILPLWVCHRNPQGVSSAVEYLKETVRLSPLPVLCGQECNMHWRKLLFPFL